MVDRYAFPFASSNTGEPAAGESGFLLFETQEVFYETSSFDCGSYV